MYGMKKRKQNEREQLNGLSVHRQAVAEVL